jgi:tRNA A37 threonylcarbamoyladenosine synthetase subunit TsaC/SUA5/YrdC
VDLVVDGGALTEVPSTLVSLRGDHAVVERDGAIPADAVHEVLRRAP